jgi:hypothetical protein
VPVGFVLIDEPEQHLHVKWHRRLLRALRKLAPQAQFLVATHSAEILTSVRSYERFILVDEDDPRARPSESRVGGVASQRSRVAGRRPEIEAKAASRADDLIFWLACKATLRVVRSKIPGAFPKDLAPTKVPDLETAATYILDNLWKDASATIAEWTSRDRVEAELAAQLELRKRVGLR